MEAPQGGFFLSSTVQFQKPPLAIPDQILLLESRGLIIPDKQKAEMYLKYIGYYRLGAYAKHLMDTSNPSKEAFISGSQFDDILDLYVFDRKLRLLIFDAMERVEVAIRTSLNNAGCLSKDDPFWLTDANNFDYKMHSYVMNEVTDIIGNNPADNQNKFISHFYAKYSDPYPPSWMMFECFSMGAVSRIYKMTKGSIRKICASDFGLQHDILESWLHSLSHARNICAHHSMCWKRVYTITPKIPKMYTNRLDSRSARLLYARCFMLQHFMSTISDNSRWPERLRDLIDSTSIISRNDMGFPSSWDQDPIWGL